jgi:iron-sulfur cluster repair protein YtfE (RIC family)
MDAIQLLKQQHDEVRELFGKYEKAKEVREKEEAFVRLADCLSAHTTIEEKRFYPAIYEGEEMDKKLREAVEEHLAAKRILADLLDMDPSDPQFDAKMQVLQEQVDHHLEEEEEELFEMVKKSRSSDALQKLGKQMEELYQQLMAGEPREDVPEETDHAAPLPH